MDIWTNFNGRRWYVTNAGDLLVVPQVGNHCSTRTFAQRKVLRQQISFFEQVWIVEMFFAGNSAQPYTFKNLNLSQKICIKSFLLLLTSFGRASKWDGKSFWNSKTYLATGGNHSCEKLEDDWNSEHQKNTPRFRLLTKARSWVACIISWHKTKIVRTSSKFFITKVRRGSSITLNMSKASW